MFKRQFCKQKHDTFLTGRDKSRRCNICLKNSMKDQYKNNPEKGRLASKRWREKNRIKWAIIMRNHNWRRTGIKNIDGTQFIEENFNQLFEKQQGCCAICKRHNSLFKRRLSVDHNHQTGRVRGLLCDPCNSNLHFYENEALHQIALSYLGK